MTEAVRSSRKAHRSCLHRHFIGRANAKLAAAALSALVGVSAAQVARAASGTWNGLAVDGAWATPGNWVDNTVAGDNTGATGANTDTATFDTNPSVAPDTHVFVGVDAGRNIGSINFASTTLSFRLGATTANTGNTLYLSGGGEVLKPNNGSTFTGDFYAPLEFTGATYTFRHINAVSTLRALGNIYARAGGGTTLTLDGTHGTGAGSSAEINGGLKDNPAGGALSIVKEGTGAWEVNANAGANANTYSGDTIINGGVLRASAATGFTGLGGFSPNSHYIVNNTGTLRNSVAGNTIRKLTVNFGGAVTVSTGASTLLNVATQSGPAVTLNLAANTHSNNITFNLPFGLTGTTPLEGGLVVNTTPGATGTGPVTIGNGGGFFNLGDVTRILDIGQTTGIDTSETPPVPSNYDTRIQGTINGTAGFIKKGPGILRFSGTAASPMTGNIEIQQGAFNPSVANMFSAASKPTLAVTGGTLHLQSGHTQTFGAVTVTKGTMTGGDNLVRVAAPSFAVNVGAADPARLDVILADDAAGAANLTKTGAGAATVEISPTYTGSTTVNGGTLSFVASVTSSSSVSVTGGTLELRASDTEVFRVIKTGPVSITGDGRLNLTKHKMITTSAAGTATEGTYNGLQGDVQRAYNFGSWNGPGLTTSQDDALAGIATIGVATGEQIRGLGPTDTDVWAGQTINGASTIAMYTYAGDANLDGQVDAGDYGILDAFIQVPGATGYGNGDFNYDGFIDAADYGTIDNSIQFQGPPIATSGSAGALAGVTAVPEPASLSVLGLACAGLFRRRRRSQ